MRLFRRRPPEQSPVVGMRTVDENVMFFYDLMRNPLCVHGVSVYESCEELGCSTQEPASRRLQDEVVKGDEQGK